MKNLKPFFIIIFLIAASIQTTWAQEIIKKSSPVRFVVGAGLELGGDEVAEVYFTNGNTQSVRAGQGGSIALGGQLAFPGLEKIIITHFTDNEVGTANGKRNWPKIKTINIDIHLR